MVPHIGCSTGHPGGGLRPLLILFGGISKSNNGQTSAVHKNHHQRDRLRFRPTNLDLGSQRFQIPGLERGLESLPPQAFLVLPLLR